VDAEILKEATSSLCLKYLYACLYGAYNVERLWCVNYKSRDIAVQSQFR